MNKENYYISGMHCRSCELLIEGSLSKVSGVKKVNADYRKGLAEIYYDHKPHHSEIEKAVRNTGYTLGINRKRPLILNDPAAYMELALVGGALLLLYIWLKIFGLLNYNLQFSSAPSLAVVGLIGLAAGISTCTALIGGLVLGISSRHAELHPEATRMQKFRPHLYFNLGRLASFTVFGGFMGFLGSTFGLSGSVLGFIIIFAGVIMFFLGLKLTGIFPRLERGGLMMPKNIARVFGLGLEVKEYSHKSAVATGIATFFVPCTFTQTMQIYAISTGSFIQGALIMLLFALGTMPGLLGIGGLTSLVKGAFGRYFFKFVALVLLVLSVWNISNGYNLTGITFAVFDGGEKRQEISGKIVNGEQIIEMTQHTTGYRPKRLVVKKDMPVKLLVTGTDPFSCSSILVIPKFRISTRLNEGVNEITFTPTETGPIKFSCAMGMYTGIISVIN